MTVKELIEKLREFDPDMQVGGSGHFGELLEVEDVDLHYDKKFVCIHIEWAGDEPD